jgi:dihydroneopterin aldolase
VDAIELTGIRAFGYHGVLEHERADGQEFVVDVRLDVDTAPAAASDQLIDTVDYATLAQAVVRVIEGEPVDLIETLAQQIADAVLIDPRVQAVRVRVHKPQAPIPVRVEGVSVTIQRSRL